MLSSTNNDLATRRGWVGFVVGIVVLGLLGITPRSSAQEVELFEGRIRYAVEVEPLDPRLTHEQLVEGYGRFQSLLIADGNTRLNFQGARAEWELYRSDTNQHFIKIRDQPLIIEDAGAEDRVLANFSDEPTGTVILGRTTRLVTIEYRDGSISKYWYDPALYVDPAPFKNHRFAYLNRYWQTAKAPHLKHERITERSRVTYTAIEIAPQDLPASFFAVPNEAPEP